MSDRRARIVLQGEDRTGQAFRSVASNFDRVTKEAGAFNARLLGIQSLLGTALGGVTIGAFVQNVNKGLLAIKDLSEATGASIRNISGLENVARAAGGSLNDASGVLIRFNAALKDASPTNNIGRALRGIGLDVEALRRADPAEALRLTAVALQQYADDGEKARLTQELFGRSVKEAAPFLRELAAAGELNGTVTERQVREADKFNKELAALRGNAEDAARAIAGPLVQALNSAAQQFRAGREAYGSGLAALFDIGINVDPFKTLEQNLTQTRDRADQVREKLEALRNTWLRNPLGFTGLQERRLEEELRALEARERYIRSEMARNARRGQDDDAAPDVRPSVPPLALPAPAGRQAREPAAAREFVGPLLSETDQAALRAIQQTDANRIAALTDQLQRLIELRPAQGDTTAIDQALQNTVEQLARLDPAAREAAAAAERFNSILAQTPSGQLQAVQDDIAIVNAQFDAGRLSVEQWAEAIAVATQRLPRELEAPIKEINEFAAQAGRNIQDALGDTLLQTLEGRFNRIGDLWMDLVKRMVAQALAAKLGNALFGAGFAQTGQIGGAIGGFLGAITGRQSGGPVAAGRTYVVGENGPERLVMGMQTGYVMPAEKPGGGDTYAPVINVNGDVGPATVQLIENLVARERARWQRRQMANGAS